MPTNGPVLDTFERPLRSLRVSVTDRCNLRCRYCMPEEEYVWLPRSSILSFEEITRLVGVFSTLGVDKVRLTGGEPLLRHDLSHLIELIAANERVRDIALTTNGVLLARQVEALKAAGLSRVTVSLDTTRPDRFQTFNRSAKFASVTAGIARACSAGLGKLKINSAVIRGFNDDDLVDLLELGEEAKHAGLALMVGSYPRGSVVSKQGETAVDVVAYGAHIAAQLGAHVVKVKPPSDAIHAFKDLMMPALVRVGAITDRTRALFAEDECPIFVDSTVLESP